MDFLGFLKLQLAANYQKLGGRPFGDIKIRKKSHIAEQNSNGDPVLSSDFVSYVKNGGNERGTGCRLAL